MKEILSYILFFLFFIPGLFNAQVLIGDSTSVNMSFQNINVVVPNPNLLLNEYIKSFSLDIDNDNINDIKFEKYYGFSPSFYDNECWITNLNSVEFISTNTVNIDTIQRGTIIDSNSYWQNSLSRFLIKGYGNYSASNFNHGFFDTINRFIGFRKQGSNIYGWIYVRLLNSGNSITGLLINSIGRSNGQALFMKEYLLDEKICVYPCPANSQISIFSEQKFNKTDVILKNTLGQIIQNVQCVNNQIDISSITQGVYYLEIHTEQGKYSKKIIINK